MDLTEKLKACGADLDLDFVGCSPVDRLSEGPAATRPQRYLPTARSVISLGYRLGTTAIDGLPDTRTAYMLEHDAANRCLDAASHRLSRFLEARGHRAIAFDAGAGFYHVAGRVPERLAADFSHKHVAVACGIGLFGINNLVLSSGWGPRVRLASVITDAVLDYDEVSLDRLCPANDCRACVEACPAGALDGWEGSYDPKTGWGVDKAACYTYIFDTLKGRRCGLCIKACPVGASAQ